MRRDIERVAEALLERTTLTGAELRGDSRHSIENEKGGAVVARHQFSPTRPVSPGIRRIGIMTPHILMIRGGFSGLIHRPPPASARLRAVIWSRARHCLRNA